MSVRERGRTAQVSRTLNAHFSPVHNPSAWVRAAIERGEAELLYQKILEGGVGLDARVLEDLLTPHQRGSAISKALSRARSEDALLAVMERAPNYNRDDVLYIAAQNNYVRALEMALPGSAFVTRMNILFSATQNGFTEIVRSLMPQRFGRIILNTALWIAAQEGYAPLVSLLLEEGADVHSRGGFAMRSARSQDVVRVLREYGAAPRWM